MGLAGFAQVLVVIRRLNWELQQMAKQLTGGAHEVSAAAGQIASTSQTLAQGSSEHAAAIEEMSAAIEEITAMTRSNVESARESSRLMGEAQGTGMLVRKSVDGLAEAVAEIHSANSQIGRILNSIDEIAFQTNILALNAAVEAARAGESGAGFAVVADEVRNLAQRCAQAARDTAQFVERNAVSADSAINRVQEVRSTWQKSGSIRDRVKTLSDEVATSSTEQDRGVQEIGRAISNMSGVTQQTAAQAEEGAAAGEQLNAQATLLSALAERLEAIVAG
jgi:methyl-accepting chemotaxis protein